MRVSVTGIQPMQREISAIIAREASGAIRGAYARQIRDEVIASNTHALGQVPGYETFVDGVEGADEDKVRPDGHVVYTFDLATDAISYIRVTLDRYSPRRSGRYANANVLFADGVEVEDATRPPPAREYVFMNLTPYARKIEGTEHSGGKRPPESSQAPDGVYNVVAALARGRYGKLATIRFGYRTALGGAILTGREGNKSSDRNPAIVVSMR